jgi:hypothetical protein
MRRQKRSWEAELGLLNVHIFCSFPYLMPSLNHFIPYSHDIVVTNVPGPAVNPHFCGVEVIAASPIVCLIHENSLGFAVLSMGDTIRLSVQMVADDDERGVYGRHAAQHLADLFTKSFEELRDRVLSNSTMCATDNHGRFQSRRI